MGERRQAEFLALVEHGKRLARTGVDISFTERRAGVWEDDGPSTHAAVVTLRELRTSWAGHLTHPDTEWVVALLDRLEAGADPAALTRTAVAEYTARYGDAPETRMWWL